MVKLSDCNQETIFRLYSQTVIMDHLGARKSVPVNSVCINLLVQTKKCVCNDEVFTNINQDSFVFQFYGTKIELQLA